METNMRGGVHPPLPCLCSCLLFGRCHRIKDLAGGIAGTAAIQDDVWDIILPTDVGDGIVHRMPHAIHLQEHDIRILDDIGIYTPVWLESSEFGQEILDSQQELGETPIQHRIDPI